MLAAISLVTATLTVAGAPPAVALSSLATPKRIADTRPTGQTADGFLAGQGPLAADSVFHIAVRGRVGVTNTAVAVVLNVTVDGATTDGFVTLYPCDAPRPVASNLNFVAGRTAAVLAITKTAADGVVCAYTSGTTVSVGTTRWFGSWDGFDRFNPALTLPPNSATVYAYTLRRILWIRDWMIANKGVDPDRVLIAGHSMGALGALTATRAFPDKFAGTLAYQCHTNVVAGFGDFLRGTEAQNLTTSLGASIIDVHDPAVLLAPGDLPPVHIIWGTTDNMIPRADKPATNAQLSAAKRGPQIWWDERTHGYPWTGHFVGSVGLRAEALVKLKRNLSYPAFSAEVSTAASTSNPWGTQGGYLEWDSDSIAETASQWSVDLWLRGSATLAADLPTFATVTVDVSIRRPQSFLPSAGSTRNWTLRRISDNALLQSGTLTVSPAGLVTAPALVIPKDPQRVRLTVGP